MNSIEMAKMVFGPYLISIAVVGIFYVFAKGTRYFYDISSGSIDSGIKNIALSILNSFIIFFLFAGLADASKAVFQAAMPVVPAEFWSGIGLPLSLIACLLAADFSNYWSHRFLHNRLFWGIHTLHHSDKHMNWSTVHRVHIFEYVQMLIVSAFIIGWLQLPTEAAAMAGVIRMWYSKYVHCQLGWTHGRFHKVLASPDYHRWHHANVPEAYGKNLCDMFPLWDVVFGTYYNPGPCTAELGVDEAPDNFFAELAYPLVYWAKGMPVSEPQIKVNTAI